MRLQHLENGSMSITTDSALHAFVKLYALQQHINMLPCIYMHACSVKFVHLFPWGVAHMAVLLYDYFHMQRKT